MTLRVALDVTPAYIGVGGVVRYTDELRRRLSRRTDVDVRSFATGRRISVPPDVRHVKVPIRILHRAWRIARWPGAERLVGPVDVVHSLDLDPPPARAPLVLSVHDALALTHPELMPPALRDSHLRRLRAAPDAAVVLALCDASADVIAEAAGIERSAIVSAPPGAPELAEDRSDPPREHVLAVGVLTPRKSFDTLAAAAELLGPRCPPVVIAGADGWRSDEVRARVADIDRRGQIRFVGPVDEARLADLYRRALVVCHPSIAEGFGITCLEAMRFGRAVVAADVPSVRELGEGVARLVPAGDPAAFAAALDEVLTDDALRARLESAGRARASSYTWGRTADAVVSAYRRAVSD